MYSSPFLVQVLLTRPLFPFSKPSASSALLHEIVHVTFTKLTKMAKMERKRSHDVAVPPSPYLMYGICEISDNHWRPVTLDSSIREPHAPRPRVNIFQLHTVTCAQTSRESITSCAAIMIRHKITNPFYQSLMAK